MVKVLMFACTYSALARAGKSLLLVEAAGHYGAGWASHSGQSFMELLQQQSSSASLLADSPAASSVDHKTIALKDSLLYREAAVYAAPDHPFCSKEYIIDLCPKVLQAEHQWQVLLGLQPCKHL